MDFNVTYRPATDAEIERTGANANTIDGAGALEINRGLVAIFNEYGIAVWTSQSMPIDIAEEFIFKATNVLAHDAYHPATASQRKIPEAVAV